ncbi:MAG: nuclear transport factor 2 family protein [Chloroflexi bacterium]|nr:nuclear transport factor 2 family protein [Chloroflexota bacterium]
MDEEEIEAAEQELMRLEHDWMTAMQRRDSVALNRLMAEDFILTSVFRGVMFTKWTFIRHTLRSLAVESFEFHEERVVAAGDVAMVDTTLTQKATQNGEPWNLRALLTDVWVQRDGRWQVVIRYTRLPTEYLDSR